MDGKLKTLERGVPPVKVKVFNCASCGSPVQIRAEGLTQICVCASCGAGLDPATETILKYQENKKTRSQVIPLGTRGKVHGTLWEVIGYMERSDGRFYTWSEYLLFNPMKGFRWLAENNGHWSYVVTMKNRPTEVFVGRVHYGSNHYSIYHQGEAVITYIIGEFYWLAKTGSKVQVKDYILENEIISSEKSEEEIIWSISEYIDASTVKAAFKIKELPLQVGVAPNQPCPVSEKLKDVNRYWIMFLLLLFGIQLMTIFNGHSQKVLTQDDYARAAPANNNKGTPEFTLTGRPTNLQIKLYSPVNNAWLSIQGELVNVVTGEQVEFDQGVEYYSGYDGEHWSEGSQFSTHNIPSVKAGTYQLNFESMSDQPDQKYSITIIRNVVLWKPFFVSMLVLSFWPMFLLWRRRSFNMKKWAESDFSPYATHHYEEDE